MWEVQRAMDRIDPEVQKVAISKFYKLKKLIWEVNNPEYRVFEWKENNVQSFGLRFETKDSELGKYTQEKWNYRWDCIHYYKEMNNWKWKIIQWQEVLPGGKKESFQYDTWSTWIEATMSYDDKTWLFLYWASKTSWDWRFPKNSEYALKTLKSFPWSKLTLPAIIDADKAIQILDRMIDEIEASKHKKAIKANTKLLLSELDDHLKSSPDTTFSA